MKLLIQPENGVAPLVAAADRDRTRYAAALDSFAVSPVNAREQLLALIGGPRQSCSSTTPQSTTLMVRALNERANNVDVRVIGSLGKKGQHLTVRPMRGFRLHTRTIVCDRREAFVGSQSLRKAERASRPATQQARRRQEIKKTVEKAVKEAVRERVQEMLNEAVED